MKYVAKPYMNRVQGTKEFDNIEMAVAYLEDYTGHKMDFVVDRKTKVKTYDWEIVGKIRRIKA